MFLDHRAIFPALTSFTDFIAIWLRRQIYLSLTRRRSLLAASFSVEGPSRLQRRGRPPIWAD
ncbi:hypothetical protein AA310_00800, partial [Arthrobacter sp. YC-RL1]